MRKETESADAQLRREYFLTGNKKTYRNMLASYVSKAATYLSADVCKYALLFVCGLGAIPKLIGGGPMKKKFPKAPWWFWTPCGLLELAGCLMLTTDLIPKPYGTIANGLKIMYFYLGGVVANNLVIHASAESVPSTIFATVFLVITAVVGSRHGIKEPTQEDGIIVAAGFVVGIVICNVLGNKKPASKKK